MLQGTFSGLRPKEPVATMERLVLVIDADNKQVRSAVVFDALGNKTEYRFDNITRRGETIPKAVFDFEIPEGVSVLDDTSAANQKPKQTLR